MAEALTVPGWHDKVMPSPDAVKSIFSAPVMAREVLKLYGELVNPAAAQASPAAS
jgi:hypothetical protein